MNDEAAVVRGPVSGQGALAEGILRALPDWFGLEQALVEYARAADVLPTFVAARGRETVGFLTLKPTSSDAVEIHVMAVLPGAHRHGIGRALVERAVMHARAAGFSMLHVKTLAPRDPHPPYAVTRAFYVAMGFRPLEVLPQVWGAENPCLLMVRVL